MTHSHAGAVQPLELDLPPECCICCGWYFFWSVTAWACAIPGYTVCSIPPALKKQSGVLWALGRYFVPPAGMTLLVVLTRALGAESSTGTLAGCQSLLEASTVFLTMGANSLARC